MALVACPECSKQISDRARACPNCGYPAPEVPIRWHDAGAALITVAIGICLYSAGGALPLVYASAANLAHKTTFAAAATLIGCILMCAGAFWLVSLFRRGWPTTRD